ncbi:MAG TPA: SAM-dependent methyltransferase [Pseudonocardia sp.]
MTGLEPRELHPERPHGARIWNYWLGGKDNFAADRQVGDAVREVFPAIVDEAVKSRQFLVRVVRHLAGEAGIEQFLDLGTGLPTMQNTHEVAQRVNPTARVVYVDNDPMVLAHARALLTNVTAGGATAYLDADYRDPADVLDRAAATLDLTRPVALLCMGVFGYLRDAGEAGGIVEELMAGLSPGSYLGLWDATDTSNHIRDGVAIQAELGSPYHLRSVAEITSWFDGLQLVEPGVVSITEWRPDPAEVGRPAPINSYGGLGRRP